VNMDTVFSITSGTRSIFGVTALVFLNGAGEVGAETLAQAVQDALTSNPDVLEARSRWQARTEELRQAEAGYRPTIDLNAGIGPEYTDRPATRVGDRNDSSEELTRKELGINLRQMLFDGYGTKSEVARQKALVESAKARLRATSEAVVQQTIQSYVDLGRFQSLRQISVKSLEIHRKFEDQIKARSNAGVGRRADYDQIEARVALAQANLVAADVNLKDAQTTYQRVVGRLPSGAYEVPGADSVDLPLALDETLALAKANNPIIEVADADILATQAQHEASKQTQYPRLDLETGGNRDEHIDGISGTNKNFSAMLRMRYNLYRGGADKARERQTAFNINESKDVRNRSLRQLEESVRLAWAAVEATEAQLPLLARQVEAARATREAYAKQFNIGQRTLLDVLNAENDLTQARQSLVDAGADHVLARYRILEAMGTLLERFNQQPSSEQNG